MGVIVPITLTLAELPHFLLGYAELYAIAHGSPQCNHLRELFPVNLDQLVTGGVLHYISKKGHSILGVVDARFLFCYGQLEVVVQEVFDLAEEYFRLMFASDDTDEEVIGVSAVEELSVVWVEGVACRQTPLLFPKFPNGLRVARQ